MAHIRITRNNYIIIDGKIVGKFQKIQEIIFKKSPQLVRKHALKAVHLGNGEIRFIADWQTILENFYRNDNQIRNQNKGGSEEGSSI